MSIQKWILVIVVILAIVLIMAVSVQNWVDLETPVKLVFFKYVSEEMPVALVALIAFAVGVVSVGVVGMTVSFRLMKQIRRLTMEGREKERELNSLRNLPVTTEIVDSEENSDI